MFLGFDFKAFSFLHVFVLIMSFDRTSRVLFISLFCNLVLLIIFISPGFPGFCWID